MQAWHKVTGLVTGMISGFFGGLLGLGGAFIIVPAAMAFLGMSRHKAHATSLAVMVFMASSAAAVYWLQGNTDLKLVGLLLAGSPLGALVGARLMHRTPAPILGILFGLFLVSMALKMGLGINFTPNGYHIPTQLSYLLIALLGAVTGCLAGLLGVGGAVISIPGLVALAGVTQQTAQGVSLLAMIPTALIGSYTHWKNGYIDLDIAPWLMFSAFIFGVGGAYVANSINPGLLKNIFSLVLLIIGLRTALSGLKGKIGKDQGNEATTYSRISR